jgi:hypothetical protein
MAVDSEARYQALLAEIERECPGFRVIRKDQSRFQRAIGVALKIVTFGAQRRYLTDYQTTIGRTVYVTADWDETDADHRYCTMRHERVHLRQFRRYTLVGMAFLYLLVPLPLGLAWFRARFEKQAYAETIRACYEVFGEIHVRRPRFIAHIVEQFTSGSYGWMWPFRRSMEAWVKRQIDAVVAADDAGVHVPAPRGLPS